MLNILSFIYIYGTNQSSLKKSDFGNRNEAITDSSAYLVGNSEYVILGNFFSLKMLPAPDPGILTNIFMDDTIYKYIYLKGITFLLIILAYFLRKSYLIELYNISFD